MLEIFKIVLQWKKQVFIFTIVAIVASVIITMPAIMPPYFKSKQIFYLSNPVSTDRAALFNEKEVGGVSIFGGKEDVNRFLSILISDEVSEKIIEKYKLIDHYNLQGEDKALALYYTKREFYNQFKALRNDLGAIEVSILDTDAKLAATMVKDIVATSDSFYRNMLTENKSTVLQLLDNQIATKKLNLQNNTNAIDDIQKSLAIRDQYAVSSSSAFKTIYTVEAATPAVKKTKPVRWMIVVITALAAFLSASLFALLIELYKHADQYGFQRS
ncbi:MAG TPA: Wzz/FepE/Etk N-terminal domain-containing protein [Chitinophagales bacterium]|nr:Wzz/FepE/Etk N-terminal domain-containing protein [Chitinophagales bacterium]HNA39475.1 Wzz/FepE/Etk N-terminal domain-containing protein [Chitinophagales bacterium]HNB47782.1 Wzz/FepE/Etk N-terminal domain-containing protein [Chitinophagales bacterium]HNF50083.1 Wzz/FepE/Etk N-terminal domain-containing protein [Chitinophagales bacterium]HNI33606.1 Wzz/FepE/Etk N-terminal domain-containing protein [Chitinophagales bacterium]